MKLDEYVAIKVTVRTNGGGVFTAETRGPDVNGGPAMNMEPSSDAAFRCAVGYKLHALAERLIKGQDDLPDRMLIEIRRDRSGGGV